MLKKALHRGLWLAAGVFFLLLGIIGLLLPIVPQMLFFLLALLCFMRTSKRFTAWVEGRSWYIRLHKRREAWKAKRALKSSKKRKAENPK